MIFYLHIYIRTRFSLTCDLFLSLSLFRILLKVPRWRNPLITHERYRSPAEIAYKRDTRRSCTSCISASIWAMIGASGLHAIYCGGRSRDRVDLFSLNPLYSRTARLDFCFVIHALFHRRRYRHA